MTDKIKLEDMTLSEVRGLRDRMAAKINEAITNIVKEFNEGILCGDVNTLVETKIVAYSTPFGEILVPTNVSINITPKAG